MRISKKGITFNYNNDEITWIWWWARATRCVFFSLIYDRHFPSLKYYWMHVGLAEKPMPLTKIRGFSLEAILRAWIKVNLRIGYYVVLYNINVQSKPTSFWRSIPDKDKTQLLSDIVLLKCKDSDEVVSLCDSISTDFASALGVQDGVAIYWNEEEIERINELT